MKVWFTSDTHFGHRLVAGLRGFDTPVEHDAAVIETFNSVVAKDDQVWFLGDMSVGPFTPVAAAMPQLNGHHHLILGNHDRAHPMFRDAHKWQRRFLEHFESVQPFARRRIAGTEVLLSHFPYLSDDGHADHGEVRYAQYRLPDQGTWLLHGHTHRADQQVHGHQIHVGLDAWALAPVDADEIAALIAAHEGE